MGGRSSAAQRARTGVALGLILCWGLAASAPPLPAAGSDSRIQDAAYVAAIADLPLMPGLSDVPEAALVFDKPAGRIVEAYAEGPVSRATVSAFYRTTLPQLGWRERGEAVFLREGERLNLLFLGNDGDLVVHFMLQPD